METPTLLLLPLLLLLPILGLGLVGGPSSFLVWARRKRYQYEVTFGLYMLTPGEKFVICAYCALPISNSTAARLPVLTRWRPTCLPGR